MNFFLFLLKTKIKNRRGSTPPPPLTPQMHPEGSRGVVANIKYFRQKINNPYLHQLSLLKKLRYQNVVTCLETRPNIIRCCEMTSKGTMIVCPTKLAHDPPTNNIYKLNVNTKCTLCPEKSKDMIFTILW